MIDDLLTEENVWDRLHREGKPLVLYGMGDGAEKINAVLESKGMHITAVFASDDFVRGQSFFGPHGAALPGGVRAIYGL